MAKKTTATTKGKKAKREKPLDKTQITFLKPAPYNPREITEEKLQMLKKAMDEFGDISGVVFNIQTGQLVSGHQRSKHFDIQTCTIEKEPHTDEKGTVAVGYITTPDGSKWNYREVDWTLEREQAANIAANEHGGAFQMDLVKDLLTKLDGTGYDLSLTGFDQDELKDLFGIGPEDEKPKGNPDKLVPVPRVKIARSGDLWQLGDHRLLCGDSTKPEDIDRLMQGEKADMVVTDPPYNVDYETKAGKIENDNLADGAFYEFLKAAYTSMDQMLKPGGAFYIYHADSEGLNFRKALKDAGFTLRQNLIWAKSSATLSRSDYNWQHEPALYGWKDGAAHFFCGDFTLTTVTKDQLTPEILSKMDKKQLVQIVLEFNQKMKSTVLEEDKPAKSELHPTQKPVALIVRNIESSSRPGEIVGDLFGGSGTTLIASEMTGRKARLNEMDEVYATAILLRYQEYTGKEPALILPDGTLKPMAEVRKERKA